MVNLQKVLPSLLYNCGLLLEATRFFVQFSSFFINFELFFSLGYINPPKYQRVLELKVWEAHCWSIKTAPENIWCWQAEKGCHFYVWSRITSKVLFFSSISFLRDATLMLSHFTCCFCLDDIKNPSRKKMRVPSHPKNGNPTTLWAGFLIRHSSPNWGDAPNWEFIPNWGKILT